LSERLQSHLYKKAIFSDYSESIEQEQEMAQLIVVSLSQNKEQPEGAIIICNKTEKHHI
jgi:hypothetical protein